MSTTFDSVFINNKSLRPAPFVSTEYEYYKSGEYIIGGLLIVTLSGTIVGEDIADQINDLAQLQTITNCVSIYIGCSGEKQFLDGLGRIRSVTINPSDQPFLASYSIQLALEIVDGKPAVEPDTSFLSATCLQNVQFLQNYSESLSIVGEGDVISSVDNVLSISKSYIKASGKISVTSFSREICGVPDYDGGTNSLTIIQSRANSLLGMNICVPNSPLSQFSSWNKWIDTQSLTIDANGTVVWSFDMYLSKGSAKPYAWIDITTELINYRNSITGQGSVPKIPTKKISGTIKGLSVATSSFISVSSDNDRMSNASTAFSFIDSLATRGTWPVDGMDTILTGRDCSLDTCQVQEPLTCEQRISSSVKKSPSTGEITFSAEYGPINNCKSVGVGSVDITVEDHLPVTRVREYIIPGAGRASVVPISDTPRKVTITGRGSLQGCDTTQMSTVQNCVRSAIATKRSSYVGSWILIDQQETIGDYAYNKSETYIQCG